MPGEIAHAAGVPEMMKRSATRALAAAPVARGLAERPSPARGLAERPAAATALRSRRLR